MSRILKDFKLRNAYESLKSLRRSRNNSDYDVRIAIGPYDVNNAYDDVKVIEEILPLISQIDRSSLTKAFEEALQKCNSGNK